MALAPFAPKSIRASPQACFNRPVLYGAGAPERCARVFTPFAPWSSPPPSKRGRAERRTHDASAASCAVKTSARVSHHESTGHIRRSARGGFFGLLRALPGNALGLTPSSPRYVTCARSGAGRGGPDSVRDHTTWADAQRRCKWGESPPRSAPRSVVVSRWFAPHASPESGRTLCTRSAPRPGPAP